MQFELSKAKEILRQTPITLIDFVGSLSDQWNYKNEGGETWSVFDILGHLIYGEKANWIPRIETILNYGETKVFTLFDRNAQFLQSKGKNIQGLLSEFKLLRNKNLYKLAELKITEDKLLLKGMHPDFGTVTLKQLIACWTVHDLNHLAQITRVLAKQYRDEVGPWKAYLPLLSVKNN